MMPNSKMPVVVLTIVGSLLTIGFGVWHFFVPTIWDWYSHINASELVLAVRAINFLFSLLLVLIGIADILFVLKTSLQRFSLIVMLSVSSILWTARVVLQLAYPQGSHNPWIQYGMLMTFVFGMCCFMISLGLVTTKRNVGGW
jgi:hypothetical protein